MTRPKTARTWWAVQHACETDGELIEREYPTLHWKGEGPDDFPSTRRRELVCDACGQEYLLLVPGQENDR